MPKLKSTTIYPSPDEEKDIQKGITSDPDAREWTEEDFIKSKHASKIFSSAIYKKLVEMKKPRGRPKKVQLRFLLLFV